MIKIKNIIYLLLLVISNNVYSQSSIVNDELYLKYEKEYFKYLDSMDTQELQKIDEVEAAFYKMFKDGKALKSFEKNKDQMRWLEKNFSKTKFSNAKEAQENYSDLFSMKQKQIEQGKVFSELLDELVKKYEPSLIWNTLKSRFEE